MASRPVTHYANEPTLATVALAPCVLVVDDDQALLEEQGRVVSQLGYGFVPAGSARQALDHLARNPAIQILIVDVQMPEVDGIALIEEMRARLAPHRHVATIMVSDHLSAELAVKGIHLEAVDLLCKPVKWEGYANALRRAARYLAARTAPAVPDYISELTDQISRLTATVEHHGALPAPLDRKASNEELATETLKAAINARKLRARFFPADLFAEPAWDILLDLTRARLNGHEVSVSSVCIAAGVPMSTALRWVKLMTERGLLRRWTDAKDRRRDLIALTDKAMANMLQYLSVMPGGLPEGMNIAARPMALARRRAR
ncbi:response regulator transcription factor [Sphingomonas sp.]|uniref:response regulator transcription factor n=1 Tax=Sphingomonas sp. TaxID=28214 RepID=UPI002BC66146|nr:response regulator transcription factor [Sphingomonas sp.]HWK36460.1 response regulator transcription factor [Sphingomonas sp.]